MQHAAQPHHAAPPPRTARSNAVRIDAGAEEDLIKINLSDLELPKVHNLHVDGLQRSWWSRLFGK